MLIYYYAHINKNVMSTVTNHAIILNLSTTAVDIAQSDYAKRIIKLVKMAHNYNS